MADDIGTLINSQLVVKNLVGYPVVITSPVNGEVLTYQSGQFVNNPVSGLVTSVFGRTGAVVAVANDYSALAQTWTALQTFGGGIALSNSQSVAFGTGGSITFTDHTATIGTSSNYVATEYLNALTFEGTPAAISTVSGDATWVLKTGDETAFTLSYTAGNPYIAINTNLSSPTNIGLAFNTPTVTYASNASITWHPFRFSTLLNFTGTTSVTTVPLSMIAIGAWSIGGTAVTVSNAVALEIFPPASAGSVTLTNAWSIYSHGNIYCAKALQIGGTAGTTANQFNIATQGAATTTMYIGNASITVVSDARLKNILGVSTLNASNILNQLKIVRFTWKDPSDRAPVNRNTRGIWEFGGIAQQWIKYAPWLVNAPDRDCQACLSGLECRKHTQIEDGNVSGIWQIEYAYAVPLLVKGFQEHEAKIATIESQIASLQAELKVLKPNTKIKC